MLERAKDYKGLAEALEREAATSKDGGLAIVARLRAAEIFRDHLAEPQRAVAAYEDVLALDPSHLGALMSIEALHAELGQSEKLASMR